MQKSIAITILFALLVSLSALDIYAVSWQSDLDGALDSAKSSGDPIMVDFYTDWCHWCKKMDSDTYCDSRVNELARDFICVQIDAENKPDLARKYSVRGYPTVIFLDSEGQVMQSVSGYRGPDDFARIMEDVLKKVESKRPKHAEKVAGPQSDKTAVAPQKSEMIRNRSSKVDIRDAVRNLQKKMNKIKNNNMELEGIIYDKICPRAIINNTVVKVGDIIEGAKVMKIEKNAVALSLGDKIINLKLD